MAPVPTLDGIARRAPFPLYGLDSGWTGRRGVDGALTGLGEICRVGLRHGGGGPGEPELVVSTLLAEEGVADDAPFTAALHLDADLSDADLSDAERGADILAPERVVARHQGRWRPLSLPVEGRAHVFWADEVGERWAAFARVGAVRVVVAGYRWDRGDVGLAVVNRTVVNRAVVNRAVVNLDAYLR
jgi:hypothetical protein